MDELFLAYWNYAKNYYVKGGSPTGELANIRDAARPLTELYGRTQASDFGPRSLEAVQTAMIRRGLSRKVINARINRVRRIFKWGVSKELVPALVLQSLFVRSRWLRNTPTLSSSGRPRW